MNLAQRIWCALFGHSDTVVRWGPWADAPEVGLHRVFETLCSRCRALLSVRSEVENQPWTP